jgi:hypothetical protein
VEALWNEMADSSSTASLWGQPIFRRGIEQGDPLLLVHRDDGIHRGPDDACQPVLTLTQFVFRLLAFLYKGRQNYERCRSQNQEEL